MQSPSFYDHSVAVIIVLHEVMLHVAKYNKKLNAISTFLLTTFQNIFSHVVNKDIIEKCDGYFEDKSNAEFVFYSQGRPQNAPSIYPALRAHFDQI